MTLAPDVWQLPLANVTVPDDQQGVQHQKRHQLSYIVACPLSIASMPSPRVRSASSYC